MNRLIFLFFILIQFNSLFAQESDPAERSNPTVTYQDKMIRQDTTEHYFVDLWIRVMAFKGGGSDGLYSTYYDIVDKTTGERIRRIDIRAELTKLGYGFAKGYANTKYFGRVKATDELLVFGGGVGGGLGKNQGAFVAISIKDGSVVYHNKFSEDNLHPIALDSSYCLADGYTELHENNISRKLVYVLFNKNFKQVLQIRCNGDIGTKVERIGADLFRIPLSTGYIELNARAFLNANLNNIIADTLKRENGIIIGKQIIEILDNGSINATLAPSFINESFKVDPATNMILGFKLPDGTYGINGGTNFLRNANVIVLQSNRITGVQFSSDSYTLKKQRNSDSIRFVIRYAPEDDYKKFIFSKWDGSIRSGKIEDGTYFVKWSDYLPIEKTISIADQKLKIRSPYLKLEKTPSAYIFNYQGFNKSISTLMNRLDLQITFTR